MVVNLMVIMLLQVNMYVLRYAYTLRDVYFMVADACYVLSFAIIMLNTSLHNPNVKDKPTVERFIQMNRDINDGESLPSSLLMVCL